MKFDEAVSKIRTISDLRRVAGAHVVDHRQLDENELRAGLLRVKPQYLHEDTVRQELETLLFKDAEKDVRVLTRAIIVDVRGGSGKLNSGDKWILCSNRA